MNARNLTFTNVGVIDGSRTWRNSETGVEIIRSKDAAGRYSVCFPTQDRDGRAVMTVTPTLEDARIMAEIAARRVRRDIAKVAV